MYFWMNNTHLCESLYSIAGGAIGKYINEPAIINIKGNTYANWPISAWHKKKIPVSILITAIVIGPYISAHVNNVPFISIA